MRLEEIIAKSCSLVMLFSAAACALSACEADKYGFGETRGLTFTVPSDPVVNIPPAPKPNDAESWFQYAFNFQAKQMWPEVIYCCKKSCELDRNKKAYWNGLGTAYQFCDKLEAARAAFLIAHQLDVCDIGVMLSVGFVDTRQGKFDEEAERFYLMALAINPGQKEPWDNLLAVLHRLNEDDLIPMVQKLSLSPGEANSAHIADLLNNSFLKKYPDDYDAIVNKGMFNTRVLNIPVAKECFEKALKLKPNSPRALIGKGLLYDAMGEANQAAEIFDLCCQTSPTQATAWACRGAIAWRNKEYATASKCYTTASSLSPENAQWSARMGELSVLGKLPGAK